MRRTKDWSFESTLITSGNFISNCSNKFRILSLKIREPESPENTFKAKRYLQKIVEGKIITITMAIVTIYALIGDDLRLWTMDKWVDTAFYSGLMI